MTIGEYLLGFQMNGKRAQNRGNRHPVYAPHGAYPCAGEDEWITIAVADDAEWRRLCAAMGMPHLATHPDYGDVLARHRNHDGLDAVISGWTQDKAADDVMRLLQEAGVSAAPVMTGEAIFNDPQYQTRGLLEFVDHPSCGPYFMPGAAWKMSETPAAGGALACAATWRAQRAGFRRAAGDGCGRDCRAGSARRKRDCAGSRIGFAD